MGRSSLEWLCFFIAVVGRGSSLLRTYVFRARRLFLAPVYDRFTEGFFRPRTCGPCEAHSTRSRSVFRNADLLVTAMRAKFALGVTFQCQTRGDSPDTADRRSHAVGTHNAAQAAPMREFLLRTRSSLSDALMSAQWREDWIPPAICDRDRFRQAPMPADR
jgi:hypothetical protein